MSLDRKLILWDTLITGAVHREGIALQLRHEELAREEVRRLFNDPAYAPESNDQAMSDIVRWTRDAVAKYPRIELLPVERERVPMSKAA